MQPPMPKARWLGSVIEGSARHVPLPWRSLRQAGGSGRQARSSLGEPMTTKVVSATTCGRVPSTSVWNRL